MRIYNGRDLTKQYPNLDIRYCNPNGYNYPYDVACGDFVTGLKYVLEGEAYYIFLGANSLYAPPQSIAIGKAQNEKIYLIYESMSAYKEYKERVMIVSEEYICEHQEGFIPNTYYHTI